MRRGFKAEAKRLALEVRAELELGSHAPLDPYGLAGLYGIPIFSLNELTAHDCPPDAITYFTQVRQAAFSAALVPLGSARFIIENAVHADTRRRASIAHEMPISHARTHAALAAGRQRRVVVGFMAASLGSGVQARVVDGRGTTSLSGSVVRASR